MLRALKFFYVKNESIILPIGLAIFSMALLFHKISARTFWMDETAVLEYLKFSPWDFLVNYFRTPDNHPPLYYFLVLISYKIFGGGELTIRLVSALSGVGIVLPIYYFGRLLFNDKATSIIAALFAATSSYFILISQMARYHSLVGFLALQGFYWLLKWQKSTWKNKYFYLFIIFFVSIGLADYPHFIYFMAAVNVWYLVLFVKKRAAPLKIWLIGEVIAAMSFFPMAYLIYSRMVYQGDNGIGKMNLLQNGVKHLLAASAMHVYAYFFGENILPWNYPAFILGSLTLGLIAVWFAVQWRKKSLSSAIKLLFFVYFGLVFVNVIFLNIINPRYNFIVYPKFVFAAFPLFALLLISVIRIFPFKWQLALLSVVFGINLFGLYNFFAVKNYLNASYFNNFKSYEFVRDNSVPGEFLITSGDANFGVYDFYRKKYFKNLKPIWITDVNKVTGPARLWFFSTGSDAENANHSTDSKIPEGLSIIRRYDSVPLDSTLKKLKERMAGYTSYSYKYSVYLLLKK